MTLEKGLLIGSRYRLEREIAAGGMGVLWQAIDIQLEQIDPTTPARSAIKFLPEELKNDPLACERFLNEVEALARLRQLSPPNVVALRDHGLDPFPYLVMDHYRYGNLRHKFEGALGYFSIACTLEVGIQLLGALIAAQALGISHRDLKPENVLVTPDKTKELGFACLAADFGISRIRGRRRELAGVPIFSPIYMAPEQFGGVPDSDAVECVDIYSLGVILFELIAGRPPFEASTVEDLCGMKQEQKPDRSLLARAPIEVQDLIVDGMLNRSPRARLDLAVAAEIMKAQFAQQMAQPTTGPTRPKPNDPAPVLANESPVRGEMQPSTTNLEVPADEKAPAEGEAMTSSIPVRFRLRLPLIAGAGLVLMVAVGFGALRLKAATPTVAPIARSEGSSVHASDSIHFNTTTFSMGRASEMITRECTQLGAACNLKQLMRSAQQRQVTVTEYDLDKFEVTNRDFAAWLSRNSTFDIRPEVNPTEDAPDYRTVHKDSSPTAPLIFDTTKKSTQQIFVKDKDNHEFTVEPKTADKPVTGVTWHGAELYCESQGKRLPTEAEWELAASGPEGRRYAWGDDEAPCPDVVWDRNAHDTGERATPPECAGMGLGEGPEKVGSSRRDVTPQSVHDLGGNVAEWVLDNFREVYPDCSGTCVDPVVQTRDTDPHVFRGGAWTYGRMYMLSWVRSRLDAGETRRGIGFRCVTKHREEKR
jgi:serine/threonine protein kinase